MPGPASPRADDCVDGSSDKQEVVSESAQIPSEDISTSRDSAMAMTYTRDAVIKQWRQYYINKHELSLSVTVDHLKNINQSWHAIPLYWCVLLCENSSLTHDAWINFTSSTRRQWVISRHHSAFQPRVHTDCSPMIPSRQPRNQWRWVCSNLQQWTSS